MIEYQLFKSCLALGFPSNGQEQASQFEGSRRSCGHHSRSRCGSERPFRLGVQSPGALKPADLQSQLGAACLGG
jgi:hypothetical protein